MTWRSVVVYWVLAAALGVHLYGEWSARRPIEDIIDRPREPIVTATASAIDTLVIRRGTLELRAKKVDDRWMLQSPPGIEVQPDLIAALVDTLTSIPPIEIISEAGADEAAGPTAGPHNENQFGLDPPLFEVRLDAGPRTVDTVELGARNPTRTAVYAKLESADTLYLLGLNAQYYVELIYEQVDRQLAGARQG